MIVTPSIQLSHENNSPLTKAEQLDLVRGVQAGDEKSLAKLVQSNSRFVFKIATIYQGRGLEVEDLYQEGVQGLIRAAEGFDFGRNVRFLTYAVWWIRHFMLKSLYETGSTIKLPINLHSKKTLEDPEEDRKANRARLDLLSRVRKPYYLDCPSNEFLQRTLRDESPLPDALQEESRSNTLISAWVNSLPTRLRSVIQHRFGLFGGAPETLEQIAERMSVTRERVRQLEEDAKKILRDRAWKYRLKERLP